MTDSGRILKNQEKIHDILPNGQKRFAKGNQIGRIRKKGYTLTDLTKVALEYDKTHDESILKHYINQLISDNRLLENFINKYVPTKTINELTGAGGGPITYKEYFPALNPEIKEEK